jgi:hypothetical protein
MLLEQKYEARKFPIDIDVTKVHQVRVSKPTDYWNWCEFEGSWYKKLSPTEICRLHNIRRANQDLGTNYTNLEQINEHYFRLLENIDIKNYKCDLCDFETSSHGNPTLRIENHRMGRKCIANQQRLLAKRNCDIYIPTSEKPAYCGICKKSYTSIYSLKLHEKTDLHKEKICEQPLPKICVCKFVFPEGDLLKCRRHLKSSTKCHKKIYNNDENRIKWLYLHARFGCKFNKTKILESMRVKFVKTV